MSPPNTITVLITSSHRFPTVAVLVVVLTWLCSTVVCEQYDNFNFCETRGRDYGPADWGEVGCGPGNTQTDRCPGWPFDWETYKNFFDYKGAKNECIDCSSSTTGKCRERQQSPVPLVRDVNQEGHYDQGEFWVGCRDKHQMYPARGTCKWEHITNNPDMPPDRRNGFRIERYGLVIRQPIEENGKLMCPDGREDRQYASVDWSGNFPLRWQLVHEEIVTPSLHTQNGIRYDAEVIMSHMWPRSSSGRQKGKITFFLQGGEGVSDWPYLNQYIAEWQQVERQVKEACCENPQADVETNICSNKEEIFAPRLHAPDGIQDYAEYILSRGRPANGGGRRQRREMSFAKQGEDGKTDLDHNRADWHTLESQINRKKTGEGQQHPSEIDETGICGNPPRREKACNECGRRRRNSRFCDGLYSRGYNSNEILNSCCDRRRLHEPVLRNPEEKATKKTEYTIEMNNDKNHAGETEENIEFLDELLQEDIEFVGNGTQQHRQLQSRSDYDPYAWWKKVNTHYYWRYGGRDSLPPCQDDVDWRIYHQPIIVSMRQIHEIERLIAERVDPQTCKRDTAGCERPGRYGKAVDVVRPLQLETEKHTVLFCECIDWRSKLEADRNWCKETTREQRFSNDERYMYNFHYQEEQQTSQP